MHKQRHKYMRICIWIHTLENHILTSQATEPHCHDTATTLFVIDLCMLLSVAPRRHLREFDLVEASLSARSYLTDLPSSWSCHSRSGNVKDRLVWGALIIRSFGKIIHSPLFVMGGPFNPKFWGRKDYYYYCLPNELLLLLLLPPLPAVLVVLP